MSSVRSRALVSYLGNKCNPVDEGQLDSSRFGTVVGFIRCCGFPQDKRFGRADTDAYVVSRKVDSSTEKLA